MNPPHVWFTPVPPIFWSAYSEMPFDRCVDCECDLDESEFYLIQKCYVGNEPVFEFAICGKCRECVGAQCSEATSLAIQAFLTDLMRKRAENFEEPDDIEEVLSRCLDECLVCGRARTACHRYDIGGLFRQSNLVVQLSPQAQSPLMICQTCKSSMSDLISQQTRDTWDRFVEDNFNGPPGINLDLPSGTPVLI